MKPSYSSQIRIACFCLTALLIKAPAFAADYKSGVTSKVLVKTSVTGNGQQITYPVTDKAVVTAMTVDVAPGAETGWHKHPGPVFAYVMSGKLSVEIEGGKQLSFEAGDAIIEVINTMHNGKNSGNVPVKLVVFYLGSEGTPNVIKAVQADKAGLK
ncbi:MAG TPA: cupin domain-containing protein [Geobacteraceae bacterium]